MFLISDFGDEIVQLFVFALHVVEFPSLLDELL